MIRKAHPSTGGGRRDRVGKFVKEATSGRRVSAPLNWLQVALCGDSCLVRSRKEKGTAGCWERRKRGGGLQVR